MSSVFFFLRSGHLLRVSAAAVAFAFAGVPLRADAPRPRTTCTLAPGVTLLQETASDGSPDGPLTVTVLQVEPRRGAKLHAALGQDQVWGDDPTFGRETVSRYLSRHPEAVAAINAGFFPFAGNPIGLHVQDGEMVTEATLGRSVFCVMKDGSARIERFVFDGKATAGSATLAIDGLNRRPGKGNELLVFTPRWGRTTLRTPGRVEVVLSGVRKPLGARQTAQGKVALVSEGGGTTLAPKTLVLSAGGEKAEALRRTASVGATVTVQVDTRTASGAPFPAQDIQEAVAGAGRLVAGGREAVSVAEEGMAQSFSTTRHPRTAVGITGAGALLLVTVDGRQKTLSRGASLPELARLMMKWGARSAVNLDGGGSSAVGARGLILNAPSDGRERPVANFLTVTAKTTHEKTVKGGKATVLMSAPSRPLRVGETWTLVSPVQKEVRGVWGLPGGQPVCGFVSQGGVFHAVRPGTATVSYVPDKGTPLSVSLTVAAPPTPAATPALVTTPAPAGR